MGKYKDSAEWADVKGITQDDSDGVAAISYTPEFVEAMDYFRAVMAAKDFSPRVMDLLDDLLEQNPANYTAWHYRRLLLSHLAERNKGIYLEELEKASEVAAENPKNYQIWYHRQVIVEILFSPADREKAVSELDFIKKVLAEDAKNYHAWSYRQWVLTHYNLWENELSFTEELLAQDIRNNSAWNQRFFVFTKGPQKFSDPAVLQGEIEFTLKKIALVPSNESAWNYLRGIVSEKFVEHPRIKEFCLDLVQKGEDSPSLLATLADIYVEEKQAEEARKFFKVLEERVDPVHRKYWIFRMNQLESL